MTTFLIQLKNLSFCHVKANALLSHAPEVIEWGFRSGYFLTKRTRVSKIVRVGHCLVSAISVPFSCCCDGLRARTQAPSPLPSLCFSSLFFSLLVLQWCKAKWKENRNPQRWSEAPGQSLLLLQQFSKAGLWKAKLRNSNSSGKMSYFSLAITPSPLPLYNGSLLPYIFMCFTWHRYSYKKQKFLAQLPITSCFWLTLVVFGGGSP